MNKLGVIGGLGSKATAYFFNRLVDLTEASVDQEHIELLIHNHPQIPDRTAYILGESNENPMSYLVDDAMYLLESGCQHLYVPCNTAHYFINQMETGLKDRFIHMIDETVLEIKKRKQTKVLLLATSGTVKTELYQKAFAEEGIVCEVLPDELQSKLMSIIYDKIKAGKEVYIDEIKDFIEVAEEKRVESIILGCTELSLLKESLKLPDFYVDAMECAIIACIKKSGKPVKML